MVDSRFSLALEEAARVDAELSELREEDRTERCASQPFLGLPFTTKVLSTVLVPVLPPLPGLFPCPRPVLDRRAPGQERDPSHRGGLSPLLPPPHVQDSPTVAAMRRAGAIPLAVTNVSELCMWMESANTVYGRTSNPYHTGRSTAPHATSTP